MGWSNDITDDFMSLQSARLREARGLKFMRDWHRSHWFLRAMQFVLTALWLPIGFVLSLPWLPFVTFFGVPYEWGGYELRMKYIFLQFMPYVLIESIGLRAFDKKDRDHDETKDEGFIDLEKEMMDVIRQSVMEEMSGKATKS